MPLIEAGIHCRVHNGQMTRFWLDTWIGEKPLCDLVQDFGSGHDLYATIALLWNGSRGWSWEKIPNLPPNIISFMQCRVMELDTSTHNEFYWKHDPTAVDHEFTLIVDGSNKVMANRAGCGGVIRNNRGEWLGGFSYRTRPNNIEEIEAKAIEKGIQWPWGRGVRDLEYFVASLPEWDCHPTTRSTKSRSA
ncbi:unnamed protein product [Cuscuta campestris]|uniref:RNase H type-1 domain-containing protein n=1 Tax=Cuscuta campestris TaxID=132261 RepID=A0A484KZP4_9ASTE|nr:unnamed protein product [Cuscuta campestris]